MEKWAAGITKYGRTEDCLTLLTDSVNQIFLYGSEDFKSLVIISCHPRLTDLKKMDHIHIIFSIVQIAHEAIRQCGVFQVHWIQSFAWLTTFKVSQKKCKAIMS